MPCQVPCQFSLTNKHSWSTSTRPWLLQVQGADAYRLPRHDGPVLDTGHMRDSEGVPDHHILILDAAVLRRPSDLSVSILPSDQ